MAHRLESEFQEYLLAIDKHRISLNKHKRIRVDQWIKKLKEKVCLDVWKKNRNTHALLLLKCLQNNKLVAPFNKMPGEGSLPQMKQHENEQLCIIKQDNHSLVAHGRFVKDVRLRSEARQKGSVESKVSEHIPPISKNTQSNKPTNSSKVEKVTKQTSLNGSRVIPARGNSVFTRVSKFLKKYQEHYCGDPQYTKLVEQLNRQWIATQQTPIAPGTFRGDDTELRVIDPSQYQYDKSYFASSVSQSQEQQNQGQQ